MALRMAQMMVELGGEELALLPERAAWWGAARTLIAADLHWGKSEAFRAGGVPIPRGVQGEQLARLDGLIERWRPERVLVVGDLLHAPAGLTGDLIERVAAWRASHAGGPRLALVPGNHDRRLDAVAERWGIEVLEEGHREGGLRFCHEPCGRVHEGGYTVAGHVHPAVTISGGGDAVKLPCFHATRACLTLPAFSRFTGGVSVRRGPGDRVFAIAEGHVLEV